MTFEEGPFRLPGRGRELFATDYIHARAIEGVDGWCVQVNLTSYRSLPLSCIDVLQITVDGQRISDSDLRLILGEQIFKPQDFPKLNNNWWFILETAEVWFPATYLEEADEHLVEGTLVKVEPYISNGRWHFTSLGSRTMKVVSNDPWKMVIA